MAGRSWLVDPSRIATKIRTASGSFDPEKVNWKSNPTKSCPKCQYVIDNSDVAHEWPGLPRGVKFDPTDQEIIWHLLTKVGVEDSKPHPFIDEFIPTVEEEDGICYTHPQNLPGVKQDGSVSHFFHRAIKAYSTGTRKRRKIHGDESAGDVRWHKTGRTKPVFVDGSQKGCKKIMVLYVGPAKGGKAEKTNWVMHQYHLGTAEDEREGEYVVSKVFCQQQQQQIKAVGDKAEENVDIITTPKVDVVTPEPPRADTRMSNYELENTPEIPMVRASASDNIDDDMEEGKDDKKLQTHEDDEHIVTETHNNPNEAQWWEDESQFLLSSQQLVEGLSLCDELLQSQSPERDGNGRGLDDDDGRNNDNGNGNNNKPRLSDYASLGPEDLKRDLLECQNMATDPANIEMDTPPDFRLSQLEFESQDSYVAWGGSVKKQDL